MYQKTITFETYDGKTLTEDFYFNFDEANIIELQFEFPDGFTEHMERISTPPVNGKELIKAFKLIISLSVGKKSEDGRRFDKSPEITADFMNSRAYSEFFKELMLNPDTAGQEFINAVLPKELVKKLVSDLPESENDPAWMKEGRVPKPEELVGATPAQMQEAFRRQSEALSK